MRDDPVVLVGFTILVVAGVFLAYPVIALLTVGTIIVWWAARHTARALTAQAQQRDAILARAEREHAQVMAGDEAGVWGQYQPSRT